MGDTPKSKKPPYDSAYRNLMLHPRMIEDLFACMVPAPELLNDLDFDALVPLDSIMIASDYTRRETDLLLRVPRKGARAPDIYVCLLLEFQATTDWWMAHRIMLVQMLAYDKLIPTGPSGSKLKRKIPPIIPLVIYHGADRWDEPLNFQALLDVDEDWPLKAWLPHFKYHVLEERSHPPETLPRPDGLTALLLRSYQSSTRNEFLNLGERLHGIARNDEVLVNRFVNLWYRVIKTARNVDLPEPPTQIEEALTMWTDNINKIFDDTEQQGILKGEEAATRRSALTIYDARFAKPTDDVVARLNMMSLAELEQLIPKLATLTQDQVHAELGLEPIPPGEG